MNCVIGGTGVKSARGTDISGTYGEKLTPLVSAKPTASAVAAGSPLFASALNGGSMEDRFGTAVPGEFSWADRNVPVTASGNYNALFTQENPTIYCPITVPVTVTLVPTPTPTPQNNSENSTHSTSAPSLQSSVADTPTNTTADLSGATFPAGVTGVSLSVSLEAADGMLPYHHPNAHLHLRKYDLLYEWGY